VKKREAEPFVTLPLLSDNGIWIDFIYFTNLLVCFLFRPLSLQKSYILQG
jgi:hypothetical protein